MDGEIRGILGHRSASKTSPRNPFLDCGRRVAIVGQRYEAIPNSIRLDNPTPLNVEESQRSTL